MADKITTIYELKPDFKAANREISKLDKRMDALIKKASKGAKFTFSLGGRGAGASTSAGTSAASKSVSALDKRIKAITGSKNIFRLTPDLRVANQELTKLDKRITAIIDKAKKGAKLNISGGGRGLSGGGRRGGTSRGGGAGLTAAMGVLAPQLTKVAPAALAATAGLGALGIATIGAGAAAISASDDYKVLFSIIEIGVGSVEQAQAEIDFLRELADQNGQSFQVLAGSYGRWANAVKGSIIEGQKAQDLFREIAQAGSVLGVSSDDTAEVIRQLSQSLGSGKLNAEEFKVIAERIPPVGRAMAESLGLTIGELRKMMADGKVLATDVLENLASKLEETFGDRVPIETAAKGFERIKNQLFELGTLIGPTLSGPVVGGLNAIADGLSAVVGWIRETQEEFEPMRAMLAEEMTQAVMILQEMISPLLELIREGFEGGALAVGILKQQFFDLFPFLDRASFSVTGLARQFLELGGVEGVLLTITALLQQLGASAAALGGDIAGGILDGVSFALEGLSELSAALISIPGIGELLEPAAGAVSDAMARASASVDGLAKDARGMADGIAKGLDAKATKNFDRAIDISNDKTARLEASMADFGKTAVESAASTTAEVKKVSDAIADLRKEIDGSQKILRLMEEFGVSAAVAKDAVKLLAEDGVDLSTEAAIELAKELEEAEKAVDKLSKSRKGLKKFEKNLKDAHTEADLLAQGLTFEQVTATMQIMEETGASVGDAIAMARQQTEAELAATEAAYKAGQLTIEQYMKAMLSPVEFEKWKENQTDARRILKATASEVDQYREEVERISELLQSGDLTKEQAAAARAALDEQTEGWVRVGAAAVDAAGEAGNAWGQALGFIGENMDKLAGAFDQLSGIASARGDTANAQILGGVSAFAQGNIGGGIAGLAQGFGLTGGGVSDFGGQNAGNFMAEGALLGSQVFGPAGAVIGAALGAFVKSGADDMHSHLAEAEGKADLVITQAEGGLKEVAQRIEANLEGFLNGIQDSIIADLDFAAAGVGIHLREDRARVEFANGMERIFNSIEEAEAFAAQQTLAAQRDIAGLGDHMRALFEELNTIELLGSLDQLATAVQLTQQLDFEDTGITGEFVKMRGEALRIARQYNISIAATNDLINAEIAARKRALDAQVAGVFGVQDVAGQFSELTGELARFDAEVEADVDAQRERRDELLELIAAEEAAAESTDGLAQSTNEAAEGTQRTNEELQSIRDEGIRSGGALGSFNETLGDFGGTAGATGREVLKAKDDLREWKDELASIEENLADPAALFGTDEIGMLWTAASDQVASSLAEMIQTVRGESAFAADMEEARERAFMATLAQQILQAQLVLSTMEGVSEVVRGFLESTINEGLKILDEFAAGTLDLNLGGGRGRQRQERQRAEEEAARAEEERIQQLEEFRATLESTAGPLGELSQRLQQIAEDAGAAAEAGASESEIRQFQVAQLNRERDDLLQPFQGDAVNFTGAQREIERERDAALAQAQLIAERRAEMLGVPMEVVFNNMAAVIMRGTERMEQELTAGVIDAFGTPQEAIRDSARDFRKMMTDLRQAHKSGAIDGRRYAQVVGEIQQAQTEALSGDVLGLLDSFYGEVEGKEELRQAGVMANFELELASQRLRFDMLLAENALVAEQAERIGGLITFMEENPPDWSSYFGGEDGPIGGSFSGGGGGFSSSASTSASSIDDLAQAIRDFVNGFDRIDVGRFTSQAMAWTDAFDDFDRRLSDLMQGQVGVNLEAYASALFGVNSVMDLTDEQLDQLRAAIPAAINARETYDAAIDALQELDDLERVETEAPDKILDMYLGTAEATSQLRAQFDGINDEFSDVLTALEELGATEEQIAQARLFHAEQLDEFFREDVLGGFRDLADEIGRGDFGGVALRDQIASTEDRISALRERVAADPLDFDALQELEAELRRRIELGTEFSGGVVGPELARLLAEVQDLAMGLPEDLLNDPALSQLQAQTSALDTSVALMRESGRKADEANQLRSELLEANRETNVRLDQLTASIQTMAQAIPS